MEIPEDDLERAVYQAFEEAAEYGPAGPGADDILLAIRAAAANRHLT